MPEVWVLVMDEAQLEAPEVYERRLEKGAAMLWDMEQKGTTKNERYESLLRHFENLLCTYELACDKCRLAAVIKTREVSS